jgi:hypothetical protein
LPGIVPNSSLRASQTGRVDIDVLVYSVEPGDPRGSRRGDCRMVARRKLRQPWDEVSEKLAAIRTLVLAVTPSLSNYTSRPWPRRGATSILFSMHW